MAATEVKGSRREWDDGKRKYGIMLYVSTLATDAPAHGSYFTTAATTLESGNTGRRCHYVTIDPDVVPGIYYYEARYMAFKAYA